VTRYGLCHCGCGGATPLATQTRRTGRSQVKGQPVRFLPGHHSRKAPVDYVEEDRGYMTPCWIWQLGFAGRYGVASVQGRQDYAHRVYYERYRGPIPTGLQIDHLCEVKACVNPDHLEPVTGAENVRRSSCTKLTLEDARHIHASSLSAEELARELGVVPQTVKDVRNGRTWREADE
jgi:hypothetical protein